MCIFIWKKHRAQSDAGGIRLADNPGQLRVLAAMVCGVACLGLGVGIVKAEQFHPPSLEGFDLHSERHADGDGDGVDETDLRVYLNKQGDSLVSFSTNGRLWAWSLKSETSESAVKNYVIRDSNCDGVFNEVYSLDDEFHVPECVK